MRYVAFAWCERDCWPSWKDGGRRCKRSLRRGDEGKTGYGNVVAETQTGSLPAWNHICNSGFQLVVGGTRGTNLYMARLLVS